MMNVAFIMNTLMNVAFIRVVQLSVRVAERIIVVKAGAPPPIWTGAGPDRGP
jgi:hypothetical protein